MASIEIQPMRSQDEVQLAHDKLAAVIEGELVPSVDLPEEQRTGLIIACDVLCWVLHHDHKNLMFSGVLAKIDALAAIFGKVILRAEEPFIGRPPNGSTE